MNRILITGKGGQLATAFEHALRGKEIPFVALDHRQLDITDENQIQQAFAEIKPSICINCAAYTAVDQAEKEENQAFAVNSKAVFDLGRACKESDSLFIHFSTDYVYHNGIDRPLLESDPTNPISIYGRSKLEGEKSLGTLSHPYLIFRISWLYSPWGQNFCKTMLHLAETHTHLKVVDDQIGAPTYAPDLAHHISTCIASGAWDNLSQVPTGIYNYCPEGVASWYDFAYAIFSLSGNEVQLTAVPTEEFPRPAARPHYSVLDTSSVKKAFSFDLRHWREGLRDCLAQLGQLAKSQ